MRRRKIRIALLAVAFIIIIAAGILAVKGKLNWTTKMPVSNSTKKAEPPKNQVQNQEPPAAAKEEGYDVKLSDGRVLKAVYETSGTNKVFKYMSPKDSGAFYNINPSGNKMVVFDKNQQNIMLIDTNGNIVDITNPSYTSSTGTVINKQDVLSQNSSYMWCDSPVFLDDNNVVYITQLPWLNKSTKYVWMVNTDSKAHSYIRGISGDSIKLGALEEKGLKIESDGSILYLAPNGEVAE